MADIKKINVNGTLYDVNLDSTKDVDIKSLKVNDGYIKVGTGDYQSMTTASQTIIDSSSITMQFKMDNEEVAAVEIGAYSGGGYMSIDQISSTEISAGTITASNMTVGTVTSGTITASKTVQAKNLEVKDSLTVGTSLTLGSKTITNLDDLGLKNVRQTEGDTTFLTVFTNPSDLTHKLQVSSAYIEELTADDLSCGSLEGGGASFTGNLTANGVEASSITLGGVKKTAWPEGGGSDYTYIKEDTNNHIITVGAGSIVGTVGTVGTTANTLNLKALQTTDISAPTITLSATSGITINSPNIKATNSNIILNKSTAIGTLTVLGLSVYDSAGNRISAGVISTDSGGAINHSFTGSIVASKIVTLSDNNTGLQISDNDITYNGVLSGTVLKVYENYRRDNCMSVGLGDTFVGSLVAKGLYLRRGNLDYIQIVTWDVNDSSNKTAYIGTTDSPNIENFKFCGTLLGNTSLSNPSSPRIYYTNSQATSGVDNMKAALDDLYNKIAALGN